MPGIRLSDITWEEARDAVERYPVALLPIGGGSKEHGPHLPLGTDQLVVDDLARRVVEAAPVMLLPTLAYAYYPAFVDWAGSVSIEAKHFTDFVGDIIRSLYRHGTRKFLILDGGVSTHPPLKTLSSDLHQELNVWVGVTDILGLGAEVYAEIEEQERGGHADEMETSCILALRPDLVHMEKAPREWRTGIKGAFGPGGVKKVHVGGKMRTPHGINGDATLATVAKGEKALAAMAQDIVTFVEHFIDLPLPGPSQMGA
ncbi:MAG: creatininase family protein [Anaerolineae bacterium]|nr:creatininase family protein [Anaerolineae bacterium]